MIALELLLVAGYKGLARNKAGFSDLVYFAESWSRAVRAGPTIYQGSAELIIN